VAPKKAHPPEGVGLRIRRARLANGLTQKELADQIGVTWQQIQRYELGQASPPLSRLADIARVLHLPMSAFVSEDEKPLEVGPEVYFRNQGMTEEDIRQVMEYAEFLLSRRRRRRESGDS
jgi:transcriptional regulator with XRE-family HTH domain